MRVKHLPDPFERDGGAEAAMSREVQSIGDLYARLERIRASIADANLKNTVTVGEQTKTIFEWLTWKREIAEKQSKLFNDIQTLVKREIDSNQRSPKVYQDSEGKTHLVDVIPNLSYTEYVKRSEQLGDMMETLDGKLSLKNATVVISV